MKSTIALLALALGLQAQAQNSNQDLRIDEVKTAGSACDLASERLGQVTLEDGLFVFPAILSLQKNKGSFARGVCNLAMSFKLRVGKKLLLSDLEAVASTELASRSSVDLAMEVFLAGSKGQLNKSSLKSKRQSLSSDLLILRPGRVIETSCGGAGILRINASAIIRGSGRSSSHLHLAKMNAQIVDCE